MEDKGIKILKKLVKWVGAKITKYDFTAKSNPKLTVSYKDKQIVFSKKGYYGECQIGTSKDAITGMAITLSELTGKAIVTDKTKIYLYEKDGYYSAPIRNGENVFSKEEPLEIDYKVGRYQKTITFFKLVINKDNYELKEFIPFSTLSKVEINLINKKKEEIRRKEKIDTLLKLEFFKNEAIKHIKSSNFDKIIHQLSVQEKQLERQLFEEFVKYANNYSLVDPQKLIDKISFER